MSTSARAAVGAALADIEPLADLHASAAYRRRVAVTLAVRAIADASKRARSMRVELSINGRARTVDVEPRMSLLDCLRDCLLLTGAHAGCEHGVCGACTVLLDGAPVRSCLMFAVQADGYAITTIEGLAPGPGELSPLQDAFCETHGMQCGYCTPAMILAAHALLCAIPRRRATTSSRRFPPTSAAAPAMRRSSRPLRSPPSACAGRTCRRVRHERSGKIPLRVVRPPRARGPPLRGRQGPFRRRYRAAGHAARGAGDLAASCRAHRCHRQGRGAGDAGRALRARRPRACGRDAAAAWRASTRPTCRAGRSRSMWRAMPANGSPPWSPIRVRSPRTRPRRSRWNTSRCRSCSTARKPMRRAVRRCMRRTARTCCSTAPSSGARSSRISPQARTGSQHRVNWGRSSTVPVETFAVLASWDPWREILDV